MCFKFQTLVCWRKCLYDTSFLNFFFYHQHTWPIVVCYKRKYVHEVLVNCLVKLAQEKCVVR